MIAGIRPEYFEDAAIDGSGLRFKAKLDVVESMGSELYAYFDAQAGEVHSEQLDELAADAGLEEVPGAGTTVVARLDATSRAEPGAEIELVARHAARSSSSTRTAGARCSSAARHHQRGVSLD